MPESTEVQDQQHPLWSRDRQLVNQLLQGGPSDRNLAELARLRVRYMSFPGARDLQRDLDQLLQHWQLTEAQLFERTRQIHAQQQVYKRSDADQEDWS
ncbi:MAG: DUF3288 family protein [Cyanobacteria bacterium P01_H01_bin.121]